MAMRGCVICGRPKEVHTGPDFRCANGKSIFGSMELPADTELNASYFADGCLYVKAAEQKGGMPTLFDLLEVEDDEETPVGA